MECDEIIEEMYRTYALNIKRICYLYLGNLVWAEDAMQETFLKAYEKYHMFRKQSDVKTWLTRIAINTCKDFLKAENRKKRYVSEETHEAGYNIGVPEKALDNLILSDAICKLPRDLREVIILFYYQEFNTKVISEILHVPRTTVEFRLKKARKEIKKVIGEVIS